MSVDFDDMETVIDVLEVLTDLDVLRSVAIKLAKLVELETEKNKLSKEMIEIYKDRVDSLTVVVEKSSEVLQMLKDHPELANSL